MFVGGLAILAEILDASRHQDACASPTARCAKDCCTTWSDASPTKTRVCAACARCRVAITSISAQSERVEATALDFLRQTQAEWELDEPFAELVLSWAARLHEIGLDVSHSHYQKHGAYLLEHADMPGFPQEEQRILACIVGAHRRKVQLEIAAGSDVRRGTSRRSILIVLLRLAVLLHRGRSADRAAEDRACTRRGARSRSRFPRAGSTRTR